MHSFPGFTCIRFLSFSTENLAGILININKNEATYVGRLIPVGSLSYPGSGS